MAQNENSNLNFRFRRMVENRFISRLYRDYKRVPHFCSENYSDKPIYELCLGAWKRFHKFYILPASFERACTRVLVNRRCKQGSELFYVG